MHFAIERLFYEENQICGKSGLILSFEFKTADMLVKTKHYLPTVEPERNGNYYCRVRRAYIPNEGEKTT
ncbi:hypothetical protein TNCV_715711 [Trichonephila clavipes]|nr:hypothetical protein TNCV_715711 [Trichonephila clavipes]